MKMLHESYAYGEINLSHIWFSKIAEKAKSIFQMFMAICG